MRGPSVLRGLRARIAVTVVLVTVAATATMAYASYRLMAGDTRDRFVAAARSDFDSDQGQMTATLSRLDDVAAARAATEFLHGRRGIEWLVVDLHTDLVAGGPHGPDLVNVRVDRLRGAVPRDLLSRAVSRRGTMLDGNWVDGTPRLVLGGAVGDGLAVVEFYDMTTLRHSLARLRSRLALIAAAVAALAAAVGVAVAGTMQRPVRSAASAAREFGGGALSTRLPVRGRDELADLARAFNDMAERLGQSIEDLRVKEEQQRRFVADVAHDLRTPVATMVAASDSLDGSAGAGAGTGTGAGTGDRAGHLLATQARRLARLVEDLLEMARFDAGAAELRLEPVDLPALVTEAAALVAPGAPVTVEATGDTVATADPRRLHTVACNLLSNAVTHGAAPVRVTVDGTAADRVTVRIADSGPGLPADLLPIAFDRFVRGDRARRATGGSGLGLAIAHENAVLHGGTLRVANDAAEDAAEDGGNGGGNGGGAGGAAFTLTLPRGVPGSENMGLTSH